MKLIRKAKLGINIPPIEEAKLDNTSVHHFVPIERKLSLEEQDARNYRLQLYLQEQYNKTHQITSDKSKERATLNNAANNLTIGINSVDPQYKTGPALVNSGLYSGVTLSPLLKLPTVQGLLTADGVINAFSKNGILKTYNLVKDNDYLGAIKSGVGDALDIYGGTQLMKPLYMANLTSEIGSYMPTILKGYRNTKVFLKTPINQNPFKAVTKYNQNILKRKNPSFEVEDVLLPEGVTPNLDPSLATYFLRNRFLNGGYERINNPFGDPIVSLSLKDPKEVWNSVRVSSYLSPRLIYKHIKDISLDSKPENIITSGILWANQFTDPAFAIPEAKTVFLNPGYLRALKFLDNVTAGHEIDHALNRSVMFPDLGIVDYSHLPKGIQKYFTPTELSARGTLIKNYYGLKEGQPLTTDMLKYAAKHYVPDTKLDNNMTQFFSGIKDWDKMAEWISKTSM